ncbi:MAG: response regulator, partial [Lachnospiraceae bacterium]|nr:response regulator [Lachnospiraceae bacterium]
MPLQNQKRDYILRTLVLPVICAVLVVAFRLDILPSAFMIGPILVPFSDLFIILAAGISGLRYGLVMFWLIFVSEMIVRTGDVFSVFPLFLYLVEILTSSAITVSGWYKSIKKTLLACVVYMLEIGIMLYVSFSWIYGFREMSLPGCILGGIPESVIVTACLYLYFRYMPDEIKKSSGLGKMYAADYTFVADSESRPVGRFIFVLSVIEGILSGLASVLMVNALYPSLHEMYVGNPDHRAGRALILAIGFFFTSILSLSIAIVVNEAIIGMLVRLVRQQDQLRSELAVSIEGSKAKTAFFSNMTHELRSPINAVLGMDEMILRESHESVIRGYAENIKSAGAMLLALINDLLDMSKIEAGKMEIVPAEYETQSVVNDLSILIEQRAAEKNLSFILDVDPQLPRRLYGDEIRIKQVFTNILTNAVKYTESGSVTLSIAQERIDEKAVMLDCHVIDTGIGIREEDQKKLFHEYERIEERRNRNIEGTGLGINIVMSLLSLMDSRLEVESEYGKGSDFHFSLVQEIVDGEPMGEVSGIRKEEVGQEQGFVAPEGRILVVDDTPMNLEVIANLLKRTKIQVDTAASGAECLEKITQEAYDIVFMDDRMPEMSGVETYKRMQEGTHPNKDTPVVILTANTAQDARELYEYVGFAKYLSKPIDAQMLEATIRDFLPAEKVLPVE